MSTLAVSLLEGPIPTVRWAFNNSNAFNQTDVVTPPQRGADQDVISGKVISTLHIATPNK